MSTVPIASGYYGQSAYKVALKWLSLLLLLLLLLLSLYLMITCFIILHYRNIVCNFNSIFNVVLGDFSYTL